LVVSQFGIARLLRALLLSDYSRLRIWGRVASTNPETLRQPH
jgi:hypothetical protein